MSYEMHFKQIGIRIHDRRKELNLTLEEVAKIVGVTKGTDQKYETGAIQKIGEDKLKKLALVLQTTPGELISGKIINDQIEFNAYVKKHYGDELLEIINNWRSLNEEGKREAVKRIKELTEISKYQDKDYLNSISKDWKEGESEV